MEEEKEFAQRIKEEYTEKDETNLDDLRKLDRKVKTFPTAFAYIFGVFGSLILGVGMCLAMNVLGGTTAWMIVGIVVGLIGIVLVSVTAPIYNKMLSSRKKKFANEILALSNKMLSEEA